MKICCLHLFKLVRVVKYQFSSRTFTLTSRLFQNYYDILNVSTKASPKEIKDAYIKLSKQHHPDLNPSDPLCHEKFVKIQNAYQTLSNATAKAKYDNELNSARKNFYGPGSPYSGSAHNNQNYHHEWIRRSKQNMNDTGYQYSQHVQEKMRKDKQFRQQKKDEEEFQNMLNQQASEWMFWTVAIIVGLSVFNSLTQHSFRDSLWRDVDIQRDVERMNRNLYMKEMRDKRYEADPSNMKVNEK